MSTKTHGKSRDPIYLCWQNMKQRCFNKKSLSYKHYGGRGISVCKRWLKFENFYEDMGDQPSGLTIDRTDNKKGYSPSNCRWVNRRTQSLNRGVFKNKYSKYRWVSKDIRKKTKPWRGSYRWFGDQFYVGEFLTQKEAYLAVLKHRRKNNNIPKKFKDDK